ncbi:MAG: acyl carrier protein [Hoeflea sp.]|uniref:acyl carrier protein n=1 Tax=Hoeflea sp. TaxID=1940281 RepID=UPI001DB3E50F|nr:phosphopantetheine-binding protein [Hoeflea sp.]MBU4529568.1 acyl carrier protein [Alphaproteobacteria bacterium]MBU4546687.1 acyl carrier protein [Alphaproteobacteria bacterium]MBU4550955.1 acyl carrier protein [Alphaproteobacteria bacterium]MBV1723897.1 acyl carrier protein [Hoeflea sp.]MBV1763174.1 acyl carrier protein [Hoeflea sp.]
MTYDTLYALFIEELVKVAPDLDPATIRQDDQLQDDLELDSMDVLNLVAALHERLGVDIPEDDYVLIETPAKAATYLSTRQK